MSTAAKPGSSQGLALSQASQTHVHLTGDVSAGTAACQAGSSRECCAGQGGGGHEAGCGSAAGCPCQAHHGLHPQGKALHPCLTCCRLTAELLHPSGWQQQQQLRTAGLQHAWPRTMLARLARSWAVCRQHQYHTQDVLHSVFLLSLPTTPHGARMWAVHAAAL